MSIHWNKKRKLNNGIALMANTSEEEESPLMVDTIDNNIYYYSDVSTKTAFELIKQLHKLDVKIRKSKKKDDNVIHLHIHSGGGDIFAAFAIIDKIGSIETPVYSYINGIAASAATMISTVCAKRYIYKNSYMLIHQLSSGFIGKYNEIVDDMENNQTFMKHIKDIYKKHTNIHGNALDNILKRDIWWPAKVCLENGLVDEIL